MSTIRSHGGRRPQVFGSVARGEDKDDSDIDLLVDFTTILDSPIDVVPLSSLRAPMRARILDEAIPL